MIARIIDLAIRDRLMVLVATLLLAAAGSWAYLNVPLDAIPELPHWDTRQWTVTEDSPAMMPKDRQPETLTFWMLHPSPGSMLTPIWNPPGLTTHEPPDLSTVVVPTMEPFLTTRRSRRDPRTIALPDTAGLEESTKPLRSMVTSLASTVIASPDPASQWRLPVK